MLVYFFLYNQSGAGIRIAGPAGGSKSYRPKMANLVRQSANEQYYIPSFCG